MHFVFRFFFLTPRTLKLRHEDTQKEKTANDVIEGADAIDISALVDGKADIHPRDANVCGMMRAHKCAIVSFDTHYRGFLPF